MSSLNRRDGTGDRRMWSRGGRRASDRPGQHPTVLVAESYKSVRRVLVDFLRERNFSVEEAVNGRQLATRLQAVTPAVILAEQTLPLLSTWQAMGEGPGQLARKHIPTIMMTTGRGAETPSPLPTELSAVLVKPFRLEAMLEEVRRALRSKS